IVAGGKNVGAEDDAAFYFGAKPCAARFSVHTEQSQIVDAQAVADAVVAGEIGAGFGGGDDVVGGDGVIGVRHADVNQLAAEVLEQLDAFFDFVSDVSVHTLAEVVAGNADAQTSHRFGDFVGVGWNRFGGGSGIVGIASGNGLQDRGDVFHVVGKRADAIERGCESDQ